MAHIQLNYYSPALKKNANVIVFLPSQDADDYLFGTGNAKYDPAKKFQTLYLLHGSYGDYLDWSRISNVERYAQAHCLAVVMPSAENSSYMKLANGEDYTAFIGKELPAFLQTMFPLSSRREDNFIAGLSMGGYGCWRIGLAYPASFGAIASLSGGMDMQMLRESGGPHLEKMDKHYQAGVWGGRATIRGSRDDIVVMLKDAVEAGVDLPKLYMNCGTEDFIFPSNEAFYEQAKDLADIQYEKFPGVHDWNFWDSHIQDVMNWLPLANAKV